MPLRCEIPVDIGKGLRTAIFNRQRDPSGYRRGSLEASPSLRIAGVGFEEFGVEDDEHRSPTGLNNRH